MLNHAAPNYKNSHPLVITLRLSLYPDRTLGERIEKWRLEQGLFQVGLAKRIGVNEMTIVNWEKGKTKPTKKNMQKINAIMEFEPPPTLRRDDEILEPFQKSLQGLGKDYGVGGLLQIIVKALEKKGGGEMQKLPVREGEFWAEPT
jgi:DNA-binding XRE family transcriptional regulator